MRARGCISRSGNGPAGRRTGRGWGGSCCEGAGERSDKEEDEDDDDDVQWEEEEEEGEERR